MLAGIFMAWFPDFPQFYTTIAFTFSCRDVSLVLFVQPENIPSMSSIQEMMAQMMGEDEDMMVHSKALPEAQIMELTQFLSDYGRPNAFRVGDLVTPRKNAPIRGIGEPHMVTDVCEQHFNYSHEDPSSNAFGVRISIRVASISRHGAIIQHWVDHSQYEAYSL